VTLDILFYAPTSGCTAASQRFVRAGRTVPGLTRLLMRPPQPLRAGADEPEECVGVWLLCLAFMTDKMKARAAIYQHSKQLIGVVV
jgi:hypothetical protein